MGKKKGLSLDEKQVKMLDVFLNTKEIYNYKEIEKFSLKAGIGKFKSILINKGSFGNISCGGEGIKW